MAGSSWMNLRNCLAGGVLCFLSLGADAVPVSYSTSGVLDPAFGVDPATLDITGAGTSSVTSGVGICDPNFRPPDDPTCPSDVVTLTGEPNFISFTGVSGDGGVPTESFVLGTLTFTNNDVTQVLGYPNPLELTVTATECGAGGDCEETRSGSALLDFVFTTNNPEDLRASADGICIETQLDGGTVLCAQVPEFSTASFDILGRFGSLLIDDLVPSSPFGFVTIDNDLDAVRYESFAVPGPPPLALLAVTLATLPWVRRRARSAR